MSTAFEHQASDRAATDGDDAGMATLLPPMQRAGFSGFCAWASANDASALGDTGSSAQTSVATPGFHCDVARATPIFRRVLAAGHGGAAAIDLLAGTEPWRNDPDFNELVEPLQEAYAGALLLFIVPFADRCGFCLAGAYHPVEDQSLSTAFGTVARHFADVVAAFPPRPPAAGDTYADRFSARERDILRWCSQGKTNWEMAQILAISENTIRFNLKRVFRKLDVATRSAAVRAALDRGVIEAAPSERKAALTEMYRSFVEGDAGPLRALLADDVVLVATAPEDLFPHAGRYEGPDGVLQHAAAVDKQYACHRFFPLIMAEDGDEVAVYLEVELTHRATGRAMCFDCAHFWTFRDDKVIHYVEMFNTAQAHRQLGGVEPVPESRRKTAKD
ncbi:MAG: LuxR C-terminal-related transcriptional regulator [Pseudomonadota bacterium]